MDQCIIRALPDHPDFYLQIWSSMKSRLAHTFRLLIHPTSKKSKKSIEDQGTLVATLVFDQLDPRFFYSIGHFCSSVDSRGASSEWMKDLEFIISSFQDSSTNQDISFLNLFLLRSCIFDSNLLEHSAFTFRSLLQFTSDYLLTKIPCIFPFSEDYTTVQGVSVVIPKNIIKDEKLWLIVEALESTFSLRGEIMDDLHSFQVSGQARGFFYFKSFFSSKEKVHVILNQRDDRVFIQEYHTLDES